MIPLGNRIFLAPEVEEKVGSIWRARMSRQMPDKGVIIAISTKAQKATGLKVLDRVVFDKHHQQLAEDEKTTIIDAKHVLAVFA